MAKYRPNCPYRAVFRYGRYEVGVFITEKQYRAWQNEPLDYNARVNFSHMVRRALSKVHNITVSESWLVEKRDLIRIEVR